MVSELGHALPGVNDSDVEVDDRLLNRVVGNPIHVFKFMRRAIVGTKDILDTIAKEEGLLKN